MPGFLFDTNLWIAIAFDRHGSHAKAIEVLAETSDMHPAYFCRSTEQSVLRLLSTASLSQLYGSSMISNHEAIGLLQLWRSEPRVAFLEEPADTRALWLILSDRPVASPKLWMDAYLAALAISANLRFVTLDQAFRQFEPHGLDLHLLL